MQIRRCYLKCGKKTLHLVKIKGRRENPDHLILLLKKKYQQHHHAPRIKIDKSNLEPCWSTTCWSINYIRDDWYANTKKLLNMLKTRSLIWKRKPIRKNSTKGTFYGRMKIRKIHCYTTFANTMKTKLLKKRIPILQ